VGFFKIEEGFMDAVTANSEEGMILCKVGVLLREVWSRCAGKMDFLPDSVSLGIM